MLYDPKWNAETETNPDEPWRALLLRAAEVIEERGWTQGSYCDGDGGVCAMGAISVGAGYPPESIDGLANYVSGKAVMKLIKVIDPQGKFVDRIGSIPDWNDTRGRTKEEVIAALRTAAAS